MEKKPLKIMAKNPQDLDILSACLQDALIPLKEATYDKTQKRFVLLANRYKWEEDHLPQKEGSRTHAGISFENIEEAQFTGLDFLKKKSLNLSLLRIHHEEPYVYITFSKKASIRLKTTDLKIKLRDAHIPWPAKIPEH